MIRSVSPAMGCEIQGLGMKIAHPTDLDTSFLSDGTVVNHCKSV